MFDWVRSQSSVGPIATFLPLDPADQWPFYSWKTCVIILQAEFFHWHFLLDAQLALNWRSTSKVVRTFLSWELQKQLPQRDRFACRAHQKMATLNIQNFNSCRRAICRYSGTDVCMQLFAIFWLIRKPCDNQNVSKNSACGRQVFQVPAIYVEASQWALYANSASLPPGPVPSSLMLSWHRAWWRQNNGQTVFAPKI